MIRFNQFVLKRCFATCSLIICVLTNHVITNEAFISDTKDIQLKFDTYSNTLSDLNTSYGKNSIIDFVHNALEMIELSNSFLLLNMQLAKPYSANFSANIENVRGNFQNFSDSVKRTSYLFHDTISALQLATLQKNIAENAQIVHQCKKRFLSFLENPESQYSVIQLINCYDNITSLNAIGQILSNDTTLSKNNQLFSNMISEAGHCDGQQLLKSFWYLLGMYTEGCITVAVAETFKFNATVNTFKESCVSTLIAAKFTRVNLFEQCRRESCSKISENLQTLARTNNTDKLNNDLNDVYPWFYFAFLRFQKDSKPEENIIGNTLNSLIIEQNDDMGTQIFLWSSRMSTNGERDTTLYSYGIEFKTSSVISVIDNINMKSETSADRTKMIGHVEYPVRYTCKETLKNQKTDSCSGGTCSWTIPIYGVGILITVTALLFITTVSLLIFICRKKIRGKFHTEP